MLTKALELLGLAWAFVFLLMWGTWWLALRMRNFGIVDIAWAMAFAPVAACYSLLSPGGLVHRFMITGMVVFWSLRLGGHLWIRVMSHHPEEDRRYRQLRIEWGDRAASRMFGFYQLQGALIVVLSAPFLLASLNRAPAVSPMEWISLGIWLLALAGESVADAQLKRFRDDPANRGKVCQRGLWYYSRHPNYFFEWLVWVSFFLFASSSPWGLVTFFCPLLMLYFLLRVTGIPMTEELSVKSKGKAYLEYQRSTSAFVPWPRKKN